jgi:hypothetical protein
MAGTSPAMTIVRRRSHLILPRPSVVTTRLDPVVRAENAANEAGAEMYEQACPRAWIAPRRFEQIVALTCAATAGATKRDGSSSIAPTHIELMVTAKGLALIAELIAAVGLVVALAGLAVRRTTPWLTCSAVAFTAPIMAALFVVDVST